MNTNTKKISEALWNVLSSGERAAVILEAKERAKELEYPRINEAKKLIETLNSILDKEDEEPVYILGKHDYDGYNQEYKTIGSEEDVIEAPLPAIELLSSP